MALLPDQLRLLVLVLVTREFVRVRADSDLPHAEQELMEIVKFFQGTDTVIPNNK